MQASQKTYHHGEDPVFPNVVSEPLYYGKRTPTHFEGYRALVDQNDGEVVSVVSESYQMVRHEDILIKAEKAFSYLGLEFDRTITLIKDGAKMVAKYVIPSIEVALAPGDIIYPTVIIKNSYDLSWVASLIGGVYRLTCSNGAYVGTMFEKFKHRHVGLLDAGYLGSRLALLSERFDLYATGAKMMAQTPLTNYTVEKVVARLPLNKGEQHSLQTLHEKTSGMCLELVPNMTPNADLDSVVWAIRGGEKDRTQINLFNLLTEFTTHRVAGSARKDLLSERLSRAMFTQ